MAQKAEAPLQKVTLNLFKGDFARLQEMYPENGASVAVRKIVRKFISEMDGSVRKRSLKLDKGDLDV